MKCFSGGFLARVLSLLLVCSMLSVSFGSAANARFISPDTMDPTIEGVGTNRYAYAGNDPVNNSDPNGHIWGLVARGVVGLLGALLGGTEPANAPSDRNEVVQQSRTETAGGMVSGALGGTIAGKVGGTVAQELFGKKKENQSESGKEAANTEQRVQATNNPGPKNVDELLMPGNKPIGTVSGGATENIRTVSPQQFSQLQKELLNGAKQSGTYSGGKGTWFELPSGGRVGVRTSSRSGATLDIDIPGYPKGFKVHQQ